MGQYWKLIGVILFLIGIIMAGYHTWNFVSYIITANAKQPVAMEDGRLRLPFADEVGNPIYIRNNKSAHDPTFEELVQFLREEDTDRMTYNIDSFNMGNYVSRLHDNAESKGIRAGVVKFSGETITPDTYAGNMFLIKNTGTIYVDSSGRIGKTGKESIIQLGRGINDKGTLYLVPLDRAEDIEFIQPANSTLRMMNWRSYDKIGGDLVKFGTVTESYVIW